MSPLHSREFKLVSAVDAEISRAEFCKMGPQLTLAILLFHNNHRYFSAHRTPMKPSFILNRHLVFVLYFTTFHEIPFRGRLWFRFVSDLVQNIIAFQKWSSLCMHRTFSPVGSAFDLKNFRSKFDPAREPSLFSLFFFSLELFSVNLYLFLLFHLRNVRKTRKKKDSQRLQLRRNVWGLVENVNFPREKKISF